MGVPISNVTRRVVFAASGTGPYAFTFEILAASDIAVYRDDTLLTLTTDYTVTINSNGTGSITLTATPTGATQIAIVGNRTIARTTDFTTGGDFFANTLNNELDQQTIFAQQNAEGLARALQAPQTDPTTIDMTLPRKADRAGKFLAFDAVTGNPVPGAVPPELASVNAIAADIVAVSAIDTEVTTVAGIDSEVSTVAGIAANVTTVAGISADVTSVVGFSADITAVADDASDIGAVAAVAADIGILAPIAADITTAAAIDTGDLAAVAAIDADVATVAGIAADVTTVAGISADVTSVAGDATDIGTVAGAIADVSTVAGIAADVTTVAGISADVTAVVADETDIGTVASNIADVNTVAGISADVSTVAGISADVTAVVADATDIGTVAANLADITAVAAIDADVTTVATNIADIHNFADVYIGPSATNPTTRNDSSALEEGDLYYNTAVDEMRVYNGSAWVAATSSPDTVVEVSFTATAGQTSETFTGGYRVGFLYVWVNGALLDAADITATNGTTVTFGTALSLNDEVRMLTFKAAGSLIVSDISDLTASAAELNVLDGVTASTAELNILDGVTASTAELNIMDGVTASTTELNYVDGVTSAIQTQIDGKQATVTVNGIVKGNGSGTLSAAVAGTDYLAPAAIGTTVQAYDADLTTLGAGGSGARTFLGLTIGTDVQAYDSDIPTVSATQNEMEAGTETSLRSMSPLRIAQAIAALAAGDPVYGLFRKADPTIVAWSKTGAFTVSTATTLYIEVNGDLKTIAASTAVTMPGSATTGTDYAIWAKTDGTLEATSNHTSPPTANARKVGGFHYAPGGNSTGTSGGDTTPAINAYSMWDLKFRPACPDPRGMTLIANAFWTDIYLCGVDHYTNGTSKYNVTIADGSSPPKVSAAFGGNGSTDYGTGTWFEFNEIMTGHGKRLPTYTESCAYAYGTTEASSGGTDPASTILRQAYTSKWGVMLATGNMWQWLRDFIASGDGTGGWQTGLTETRGNIYTYNSSARAGLFGGSWSDGSDSGSRCSGWGGGPSNSGADIGARGVCDHLQLD